MFVRSLIPALTLLATAAPGTAQRGDPLPQVELEGFSQTPATSLDDYRGRLLLLEYFAYW